MSINHVLLARIVDLFLHTNTEFYAYTSWSHLNSMETKCIGKKVRMETWQEQIY